MPFVLAPLLLSAIGITATASFTFLGITITALQVASFVISVALTVGLNLLLGANRPKPRSQELQTTNRQDIPARVVHYDRAAAGDARLFDQAKGPNLHIVSVVGHGRYQIVKTLFGDTETNFDGAGVCTTVPPGVFVKRQVSDGSAPAAFTNLQADFPEWTSAHQALGMTTIAYTLIFPGAKGFQKAFPSGEPVRRHVLERHPDFVPVDLRTGLRTAHSNAGMVIYDYVTYADGLGVPAGKVHAPSFIAFADMSDELVARKGGGTDPRYRISGSYALNEQRRDVLGGLTAACDARVYIGMAGDEAGKVCITGGKYDAPTVTLTLREIESIEWAIHPTETERKNEIIVRCVSEDHNWSEIIAARWRDEVAIAREGKRSETVSLRFCRHVRQAQRLAKIVGLTGSALLSAKIKTNAYGLNAYGQHTLRIEDDEAGIYVDVRVESQQVDFYTSALEMSVRQVSAGVYEWSAETDEQEIEPPAAPGSTSTAIPSPSSVTAQISSVAGSGGQQQARIRATWTAPNEIGLDAIVRYRRSLGGGNFDPHELVVVPADAAAALTPAVANDGSTYEVQVAFRRGLAEGDYAPVTPLTVVATADGVAPGAATINSATGGAGQITVVTTLPNSSNVAAVEIYRNTTNSLTGATLFATVFGAPNQQITRVVTGYTAGTRWVLVRTLNGSGVPGTVASASATVT